MLFDRKLQHAIEQEDSVGFLVILHHNKEKLMPVASTFTNLSNIFLLILKMYVYRMHM